MSPQSVRIVEATPDHAALLSELGRQTFIETFGHLYTAENLNHFLDSNFTPAIQAAEIQAPNHRHVLAYLGEEAVAYAKSGPNKLPVDGVEEPAYELHRIYVLPHAKGRGIGKALVEDALAFFERQNAKGMYLGVYSDNHAAQDFYHSLGFTIIGEYDFMVGEHADHELIMRMMKK